MDIWLYGGIAVVVALIALKLAFFTIKKVIVNVILGAAVYAIATYIFHIDMQMGFIMWALTVLFGPIPVIILALWRVL